MTFCEFFPTEYNRNYRKKKLKPAEIIYQRDYFSERIEEGEIDPHTASIPTQLDEAAEQLVYKHILDNLQSVYQVTYTHPWISRDDKRVGKEEVKEKDLQNELVTYIHDVYLDPHEEKVLAPPVTAKRSILAAICFHLHWLKGKERLERWYSKTILRKLNIIGFLSAVAGITALIWYLFVTLYYKIPITPFETSTAISAVWGTVCGQWGIFLMYYAHKYELIIEENSEPILTESNA
ncbi:PREDICTED: uncharacterized protein LOC108546905 [Eufriesea mexicana]|uniref:uncharacterized protein LOC108546905 n=1 Tax=Eufriesea mexicana TaxID=516756 RepID=UPI00083BE90C|nr:PREDICTED: uncharacterized protein LOC108546905 [Eufriesea mexicana]